MSNMIWIMVLAIVLTIAWLTHEESIPELPAGLLIAEVCSVFWIVTIAIA